MLLTIACLLTFSSLSYAQSTIASIPENAHAKSYGDGWECDPSFRAEGDKCTAVLVPENAYLTNRNYGAGWQCHHGFKEVGGASCLEVMVPAGGYLDPSGKNWDCLRGYRKTDNNCEQILLPAHAYLSDNSYGSDWLCERGYREVNGSCEAVAIPENAYFDDASYGAGWKCERGFSASDDSCTAIILPANAHLDRSGNRWDCNRNFQRSKSLCVLRN